jgi:hypothetical protein
MNHPSLIEQNPHQAVRVDDLVARFVQDARLTPPTDCQPLKKNILMQALYSMIRLRSPATMASLILPATP